MSAPVRTEPYRYRRSFGPDATGVKVESEHLIAYLEADGYVEVVGSTSVTQGETAAFAQALLAAIEADARADAT